MPLKGKLMAKFKHHDLKLLIPSYDSKLTDMVIELDYLRKKTFVGTTHPDVFTQLKDIFHMMESIGSARIEGNRTTIAEYIEFKMDHESTVSQSVQEILNMERAIKYVDDVIDTTPINDELIHALHGMTVTGLTAPPYGEGDVTPGKYRDHNVSITHATHKPCAFGTIPGYMQELFQFINEQHPPKYDLIKTAIAHHRFAWIHPYGNGNGRTVRLFTYAMLVKQNFNIKQTHILNPTAVFCNNRIKYYEYLSKADTGTTVGIQAWCEYVLDGLRDELTKIDQLLEYDFLKRMILLPAVEYALQQRTITENEAKVLKKVVEVQELLAHHLKDVFPKKNAPKISKLIADLKAKNMLRPITGSVRKYVLSFDNSFLLRGIIRMLDKKGFLPNM